MSEMPQKLGRYEILEEIGKGAMGVVYLARDPLIGRLVALKTFRIGFSARDDEVAQYRSRFVREAQSAGILSHPNIVTVHDVVDEGLAGTCFIAMEYVKGTNLKQLLQRPDPFPLNFVVEVLAQVADGLDYAHSRGVVHRDIKPANILITPDNRVKITDFGIARIDSSNLTMEGQLLGTPNYMAPEQIQGREVDHRADIFSLGVVFYEMLTRRKPFQGENLTAVTHKIVYDAFTPPDEIVRDLPKAFSEILGRCLEKDPNRRYPRASEVSRELRAVLEAQQALDDTVATQEVEPLLEPAGGGSETAPPPASVRPPASLSPAASAPLPENETSDVVPTRLMARPTLPPATPPDRDAAGATADADRLDENAPTRLVARPMTAGEAKPRSAPAAAPRRPGAASDAPDTVAATALSSVPRGAARPLEAPPPASAAPPLGGRRAQLPWTAPAGAKPAASPTVTSPATSAAGGWSNRRIAAVAVSAVGAFAIAAIAALSLRGSKPEPVVPEQPAPAPTVEQQSRVTAATAIAEARSQLAQGNLDAALQAVARAELAEHESPETTALREEIEARQREIEDAERNARAEQGLRAARYAYAERRYSEAVSAAKGVLAVAAENEEAKRIIRESEGALNRLRERQEAIEVAQRQATAAAEEAATAEVATATAIVAKDAQLHIDFFSERSEGVLTVYAGDRQILREPFRFVRRTGFLSREKVSGAIQATRRLAPGQQGLRVYVALQGEATRTVTLEGDLALGSSTVLEVRVDAAGGVTARLR
ncbi:MAG TPA: protein kinase [Thermoanaerobaculia bacterium]|jgi:serine/threonine-protein kinase